MLSIDLGRKQEAYSQSSESTEESSTAKASSKGLHSEAIGYLLVNADLLLKHNETAEARTLISKALSLNSHSPQALRKLLQCLSKPSERNFVLARLIEADRSYSNLLAYAHSCYQLGDDVKAKSFYFEALLDLSHECSELFEIYKNLGNIFLRAGDQDAAQEYFSKALAVDPKSDTVLVNLGTLDIQRFDYESAKEKFRQALQYNIKNDKAWVGLALIYLEVRDMELAIGNLSRALDANPSNKTAVQLLSTICLQNDCPDEALEPLQNFLDQVGQDEDCSFLLAQIFALKEQWQLADIELDRLLFWNPKHMKAIQLKTQLQEIR